MGREGDGGATGRLVAGRYRLGDVLGRGGMGTVWRARDEVLGRAVAVKELRFPGSVDDEEKRRLITRTLREAKAIARIRNSSAVTVYDVVEEDDRPWIVMELVEGRSLAEVTREDGPLTPKRAAEVGLAVLDVLRAAHGEGILHRDVKPSNVLISEDGRVVLTDFGIAQVEGDPSITSTGMLVGAPSYISPERARGQKPGPASDLWSLGGLLYAAVEGHPPYDLGSAIATLTAVMTKPLDPPKNAGPLEDCIYGLLAKDPEQRLGDEGARVLLRGVIDAPEGTGQEPPEALAPTKVVPLPVIPEAKAAVPVSEPAAPRAPAVPPAPPTAPPTAPPAAAPATAPAAPAVPPAAPAAAEASSASPAESASQVSPASSASAGEPAGPAPAVVAARARAGALAARVARLPRRTLIIIAAVVALAILGTALAVSLGGGDGGAGAAGKGSDKNTGTGTGQDKEKQDGGTDKDKGQDGEGASKDDDEDEAKDEDKAPPKDSGGVPDGFATVTERQFRFSIALPEGWQRTSTSPGGGGAIFSGGAAFPRVQVDFTPEPNNTPGGAVANWRELEGSVSSSSAGYRRISLGEIEWRGYPTVADWQFSRTQDGQAVRILNRGFAVDSSHGYAIMITCPAGSWGGEECSALREAAFASFKPVD